MLFVFQKNFELFVHFLLFAVNTQPRMPAKARPNGGKPTNPSLNPAYIRLMTALKRDNI